MLNDVSSDEEPSDVEIVFVLRTRLRYLVRQTLANGAERKEKTKEKTCDFPDLHADETDLYMYTEVLSTIRSRSVVKRGRKRIIKHTKHTNNKTTDKDNGKMVKITYQRKVKKIIKER